MREICKSGSEGGGGVSRSLPLSFNAAIAIDKVSKRFVLAGNKEGVLALSQPVAHDRAGRVRCHPGTEPRGRAPRRASLPRWSSRPAAA